MMVEGFLRRVDNLRLDKSRGPVKPYKPLLLAAVVILIAKRKIADPLILLDGALRSVFEQLLHQIHPAWEFRADVRLPFRHLENDGVWAPVPADGALDALHVAKATRQKAREVLRHVACARLDEGVFRRLARSEAFRDEVLSTLVRRYFQPDAAEAMRSFLDRRGREFLPAPPRTRVTERIIEEQLQRRWPRSPFARMGIKLASLREHGIAGRQVCTPVNTIDLLGYRRARAEWWVFELKRGRPADAVVGQVSRYVGWIQKQRGESTVGAVLAERADAKLQYAVEANPRLSLWTYDAELRLTRA